MKYASFTKNYFSVINISFSFVSLIRDPFESFFRPAKFVYAKEVISVDECIFHFPALFIVDELRQLSQGRSS